MVEFVVGNLLKKEQGLVMPIKDLKRLAEELLKKDHAEYNNIRNAFMHQLDVREVVVASIARPYLQIALPDEHISEIRVYAEKLNKYHHPFDVLFTLAGFSKSPYVEQLLGTTLGYEPLLRGLVHAYLEVSFSVPNPNSGVFAYEVKKGMEEYLKKKAGKQFSRFSYTLKEVSKEELDKLLIPGYSHYGIASPEQPVLFMHTSSAGVTFATAPLKGGVWISNIADYVDQLFAFVSLVLEDLKSKVLA